MPDTGNKVNETEKLLIGLKQLYRVAGLTYGDAAAKLGISVNSVKRYMAGKALTMAMFEQLCLVVGLTISELADVCRGQGIIGLETMTIEQEDAFGREPHLSLIFLLLWQGWTPEEISAEFELTDAVLLQYLTRLDRYGFIMLFPGNRVKVRVVGRWKGARSSELTSTMKSMWSQAFPGLDVPKEGEPWQLGFTRLAPQSLEKIRRKFNELSRDVFALIEEDRHLPADQVRWYAICMLCREGLLIDKPVSSGPAR